jgi:O-antigen/teichoic acid export membrane protein
MGPMLSVLCGLSVFRPISGVLSSYLNARGRPGLTVLLEVFSLVMLLVLTPILGWNSPLIMCGVAVSAFGLRAIANMWVVGRLDNKSTFTYLARIAGPAFACVPMVGAVLGVRYGLVALNIHSHLLSLILEVIAGGVVYVGMVFVVARSIAFDFLRTLRDAVKRRRS